MATEGLSVGNSFSISDLWPDFGFLLTSPLDSSQGITAVFTLILLVVFVMSLARFLVLQSRARKNISFFFKALKDIQTCDLIVKREQIREDMKANAICSELWNEFDESLVESKGIEQRELFNTVDAAHFFGTHTLARGVTENRLIAAMPGVLTAIGVLGTFAGLTLGLGGLGQIGGADTQLLKDGILKMINAASIAFTTSFWGVFLSVLFNAFEKWRESEIRKAISNLQDRIDYLFPRLTPEKMLMDISIHSKSSDETMLGLAEKIGDRMQEAVLKMKDEISHGMASALHEVLTPAINRLVASSEDMAKRQTQSSESALESVVQGFMEKFGQVGAEQGEMMRSAATNLQELMDRLKSNQETSMERSETWEKDRQRLFLAVLKKMSEQVSQLKHSGDLNSQSAENVILQQKSIADDLGTFSGVLEQASEQLGNAAKEIRAGNLDVAKSSQLLAGVISDAARENSRVSQSNVETSEMLRNLLREFEDARKSAVEISNQLRASAEAGASTFNDLKQHQEEYRTALSSHVEELAVKLSEIMESYAEEVGNQTNNRLQAWDTETLKYTTAMQGVLNAMQETVDEISNKNIQ